jgi:hypothetical protein
MNDKQAQAGQRLKSELKKYISSSVLILDELGYLPIDKRGVKHSLRAVHGRDGADAIVNLQRDGPRGAAEVEACADRG